MVQLGYVVLFAPAFPLASALLFASFYFELRTDAYKMVCNTRRPPYIGGEDIGSWQVVLRVLAALGVLTNVGLVGVTDTTLKRLLPFKLLGLLEINESNKLMFLIVIEHLLLLAQFCVVTMIPDVPEDLAVETASQQWRAKAPREPPPPPPAQWDDDALIRIYGTAEKANKAYYEADSKSPTVAKPAHEQYYDMAEALREIDAALRDGSGKKLDLNNGALRDMLRNAQQQCAPPSLESISPALERLSTVPEDRISNRSLVEASRLANRRAPTWVETLTRSPARSERGETSRAGSISSRLWT